MDLINWLSKLVAGDYIQAGTVGVTVGALIYNGLERLDKLMDIPPTVKRIGAPLACLLVSAGAYYGLTELTHAELTANGWFLVACVVVAAIAYGTSQVTHSTTE